MPCDDSCLTCNGGFSTDCTSCEPPTFLNDNHECVTCESNGTYLSSQNQTCVSCNAPGYFIDSGQCFDCDSSCLTCNGESNTNCTSCAAPAILDSDNSCVTCTSNGTYLYPQNQSCVDCNEPGYFRISGQCLACDSNCKTCSGTSTNCLSCYDGDYLVLSNNSCTQCKDSAYYANDTNQSCYLKQVIAIIKIVEFTLKDPPLLYSITFDSPFNMTSALGSLRLYQFYTTVPNGTYKNMSAMTFSLNQVTQTSYELTLTSYTETDQELYLLLSFDYWNSNSTSHLQQISPSRTSAPVYRDTTTVVAAEKMGVAGQAVAVAVASIAFLSYLQAKGVSSQLMKILQIMARITFMRMIDVNFLTPLATFYQYTDLGQFGVPNVIGKVLGAESENSGTEDKRILTAISEETSGGLIYQNPEGELIYNSYFNYTFSRVFLDGYGGIVFSSLVTLLLYLFIKIVVKCMTDNNSKIKKFLQGITDSFEKSLIVTFLISRYMHLNSSLIFTYTFVPLTGTYQVVSFVFACISMILLLLMMMSALCIAFYAGAHKRKLRFMRPFFRIIIIICQDYRSRTFLGRILAFWYLLSNLLIAVTLLLLRKWPIIQLSILIFLNVMTICFSLPKKIFKTTSGKLVTIFTELCFLLESIVLIVMYVLEDSGNSSYQVRLAMSWAVVAINLLIILIQVVERIVTFIIARRKAKEAKKKSSQVQQKFKMMDSREQVYLQNPKRRNHSDRKNRN